MSDGLQRRLVPWGRAVLFVGLVLAGSLAAQSQPERAARHPYDVPAGDANETLRAFAQQSGEQIVYLVDQVRGQRTGAVRGRLTALEALQQMLAPTALTVRRDLRSGAMTVVRRPVFRPDDLAAPDARQPTGPPADELVELSPFTVSAHAADRYRAADAISAVRVRAPLNDTPSSISVVTRDVVDDLLPTRIFDVTRYVAGIEDGRGIAFSDRQIIRGFESNGRTVDNFLQTGADNYDEALIERIEISKGPNAILAPAGVPGGSINVITKSPSFTPARTLTAVAGLFDAQKVTLDLTGPVAGADAFAYRLIGSVQDTRRYWADDVRLRNRALAPMLSWRLSERALLTLKLIAADHWIFREPAYILDPSVTLASDKPVLAPGFSTKGRNGTQPWSHVGTQTVDASALLTVRLSEHVSLRAAANGRYYHEDSTQQFLATPNLADRYNPYTGRLTQDHTWAPDPATGEYVATFSPLFDPAAIPLRADTQDTTLSSFTAQNDVVLTFRPGGVGSQTVAGWALAHSDRVGINWRGTLPPLNLLAPDRRADPVWSENPYLDQRLKTNNWQAYVHQRFGFLDDRVEVAGALMHYDIYTKSHSHITPAEPPSILDDARDMVFASVLVKPRPNVSLYYAYSTNSTPDIVNEAPLWQDGQQHEVGLKTDWLDQRLAANVAWFDITQTNVWVQNPERLTNPDAPEQLVSNLRDHGFELEVSGGLTPHLSILAAYTELRLRDNLGRRVRGVADRNAALLLNYRFRDGATAGLSLTLGVTYAGARTGDTTPVDYTPLGVVTQPSFRLPAYTILNAGASYRWRHYRFRLNVDNVLDDAGYVQQAGGRVSGTGLSTATGINVKLAATVEF